MILKRGTGCSYCSSPWLLGSYRDDKAFIVKAEAETWLSGILLLSFLRLTAWLKGHLLFS